MKNKWLIIAVLLPLVSVSQQSKSKGKIQTVTSVGFAAGESTAKPLFQVSGGWTFDRYYAGVGVGFDQYFTNSIPLFADGRFSFGRARWGFAYVNGGYNFTTDKPDEKTIWSQTSTNRLLGGFYMDAGLGYRIHIGTLHRLLISAGYSQKNVVRQTIYTNPCLVAPCPETIVDYRYKLGRIVTKVSWEFSK
jgi:hypothetical protein